MLVKNNSSQCYCKVMPTKANIQLDTMFFRTDIFRTEYGGFLVFLYFQYIFFIIQSSVYMVIFMFMGLFVFCFSVVRSPFPQLINLLLYSYSVLPGLSQWFLSVFVSSLSPGLNVTVFLFYFSYNTVSEFYIPCFRVLHLGLTKKSLKRFHNSLTFLEFALTFICYPSTLLYSQFQESGLSVEK